MAYKLELPTNFRVQPVFHVSRLRQRLLWKDNIIDQDVLVDFIEAPNLPHEHEQILDSHDLRTRLCVRHQVLVKWKDRIEEGTTWKNDNELHSLLKDIVKHFTKVESSDEGVKMLESIVVRIMGNAANIKDLLSMPYFMDLLDKFHGEAKNSVHKQILSFISRRNHRIGDPVERQFAFELSNSLHKSLDSLNSEDEQRQLGRLICHFVQLVDFKEDLEQHLLFLMDCRGTFTKMESLKGNPVSMYFKQV
ncbi:hypothetical protein L7F22_006314 [Adiantum nelumboides]|nr:hypothetical protein [Adiantum nelumboides]